jgi:hypothetical protein
MSRSPCEPEVEVRRSIPLQFPDLCVACGQHTHHRVKVPIDIADKLRWGIVHIVSALIPLVGIFSLAASPSGETVRIPVCWHCRQRVLVSKVLSIFAFMAALACFMFLPARDPMELVVGILGVVLLCTASALSAAAAFLPLPVTVTRLSKSIVYRFRTGAYRDWINTLQGEPQQKLGQVSSESAPSAPPDEPSS